MKKAFLLLFMSSIALRMLSGDYAITFTATGAASVVDYVTAKNLTTNESILLPGNETLILHTASSTGIQMMSDGSSGSIYPNPFVDKAELMLNLKENQTVRIQIINPDGKILAQESRYLPSGDHLFTLIGNAPGIYFVHIATNQGSITYKVLCIGENGGESSIVYGGVANSDKMVSRQTQLKNTEADYQLDFTPGDIMIYYCESNGIYMTIFTASPTSSMTYPVEFVPCTDADGNNYPVVKIGGQWWMADNLRATKYSDGTSISLITDNDWWGTHENGAYCYYNNDANLGNTYGYLYNCYVVHSGYNIAPNGWHIPSDAEWSTLITSLGGTSVAGGKMKENGYTYWQSPNTGADNSSGFSAAAGGCRTIAGDFINLGLYCGWWSYEKNDVAPVWDQILAYNTAETIRVNDDLHTGLNLRCIRD